MMKRRISLSALLSSALTATAVYADDSDALKSYLAKTEQFKANFAQTVYDGKGELLQESAGEMALARPNKLRWHVTEPDEEFLISDGHNLWFYSPFLEQVSVYDLSQSIAQSPFMLLTSVDPAVWADYEINKTAQGFNIVPKTSGTILRLEIQLKGDAIGAIEMLDAQGQRSLFKLSKFTPVQGLAENLFEFTPPAGVEIDDQR